MNRSPEGSCEYSIRPGRRGEGSGMSHIVERRTRVIDERQQRNVPTGGYGPRCPDTGDPRRRRGRTVDPRSCRCWRRALRRNRLPRTGRRSPTRREAMRIPLMPRIARVRPRSLDRNEAVPLSGEEMTVDDVVPRPPAVDIALSSCHRLHLNPYATRVRRATTHRRPTRYHDPRSGLCIATGVVVRHLLVWIGRVEEMDRATHLDVRRRDGEHLLAGNEPTEPPVPLDTHTPRGSTRDKRELAGQANVRGCHARGRQPTRHPVASYLDERPARSTSTSWTSWPPDTLRSCPAGRTPCTRGPRASRSPRPSGALIALRSSRPSVTRATRRPLVASRPLRSLCPVVTGSTGIPSMPRITLSARGPDMTDAARIALVTRHTLRPNRTLDVADRMPVGVGRKMWGMWRVVDPQVPRVQGKVNVAVHHVGDGTDRSLVTLR